MKNSAANCFLFCLALCAAAMSSSSRSAAAGGLITNITVSTGKTYTQDTLAVGKLVYIDRAFTFTSVPAAFNGEEFIRTANDDKFETGANFLSFTLRADADVFVAFDVRATTLPAWLDDGTWTATGDVIGTSDVNRNVYRKSFPAGNVTLGGNMMAPEVGAQSNYNVIAKVVLQADLSITKTDSPDPVFAGSNITYTVTLTNLGPNDAAAAQFDDTVPANTTFQAITPPAGWTQAALPPVGGTGAITFTRGALAVADGAQVFTIVVQVNPGVANGTNISNSVTAASTTSDPDPSNNSATAVTLVNSEADLALTKSASAPSLNPGDALGGRPGARGTQEHGHGVAGPVFVNVSPAALDNRVSAFVPAYPHLHGPGKALNPVDGGLLYPSTVGARNPRAGGAAVIHGLAPPLQRPGPWRASRPGRRRAACPKRSRWLEGPAEGLACPARKREF